MIIEHSVLMWKYYHLQVQLSVEDIETILSTLIYDGKVESSLAAASDSEGGQVKLYRAVMPLIEPTGLMKTPCGVCPVGFILWLAQINQLLLNRPISYSLVRNLYRNKEESLLSMLNLIRFLPYNTLQYLF